MLAGFSKPVEAENVEEFVLQLKKCIVEYIEIIESCDLISKLNNDKSL